MEQWATLLPVTTRDPASPCAVPNRPVSTRHAGGQARHPIDVATPRQITAGRQATAARSSKNKTIDQIRTSHSGEPTQKDEGTRGRHSSQLRLERIPSSRSWDPFNALSVLQISKTERFMLNYAYTRSWAVWGDNFVQSWMRCTMESSAAFYAQIFGASSHYQVQRRGTLSLADPLVTVRQRSKAMAIEKLRGEVDGQLKHPSNRVPDALMMTIFTLAVHDSIDVSSSIGDKLEDGREEATAPMGYLAKCRDMQIYTWVNFGSEHMDMILRLLEQSGGMTAINNSLFSIVLPLLDLIYSARNDLSPRIPCQWKLQPVRHPRVWQPDDKAIEMLLIAGCHFRQPTKDISDSSLLSLDRRIRGTISVLAECSVVLDHIQRVGPDVVTDSHVWMGNCNWACHKLLSIGALAPTATRSYREAEGKGERGLDVSVYFSELCRLTAILYIDQIIFPTFNPQAEIKSRLTSRLLDILETVQEDIPSDSDEWAMVCDLVRWAALMGAISSMAIGGAVTDRYIAFIADHCIGSVIQWDWEAIRDQMVSFLWIDDLDQRGQKIWQRTCERIKGR